MVWNVCVVGNGTSDVHKLSTIYDRKERLYRSSSAGSEKMERGGGRKE